MTDVDETMDSTNRVCPYCRYEYQPEGEDYSEDEDVEECDSCGKKYHAWDSFTVDHHARPDCTLNNEEHNYALIKMDVGGSVGFCTKCNQIQPSNEREMGIGMIRVVTETTLNDSLNQVLVRDAGTDFPQCGNRAFEAGHYVVDHDEGGAYIVLEGPHADEAYAKHRAHTLHGMARTAPEEITEADLPW